MVKIIYKALFSPYNMDKNHTSQLKRIKIMKKSIIAVSVVAVLGAAWIGTSWYTGKVIESKIDYKLNQFADVINNNQTLSEVKISYTDYQRGLFSTTLHLIVEEVNSDEYSYHEVVEDDITIYHGPFPWSELKSFNLMPQLAGVEYEMTEASNEKLWEITNQQPYLTMKTAVDYSENITIKAKTLPIDYQDEDLDTHYMLSAASLHFSTDKQFTQAELELLMDQFLLQDEEETFSFSNLKVQLSPQANNSAYDLNVSFDKLNSIKNGYYSSQDITVNKLAYQSMLDISQEIGFTYNNKLNIDNITFIIDDAPVVLKQLHVINENASADGKNVTGAFSYTLAGTTMGKQDLGSSNGKLSFENLPLSSIASTYLSGDVDQPGGDYLKFHLESLSWTNSKGTMDMGLLVEASALDMPMDDIDAENLDEVIFTLNVPFDSLSYLIAQVSNADADAINEEEIEEAQQSIMMMTMFFARSPIFNILLDDSADKKAGVYSELSYSKSKDEAYINGEEFMVEDFFDELK